MTNTVKKILVNFRINAEIWKKFKQITLEKHSDSSKQLRIMIDNYIKFNKKK